jgi:hypothetical protein
MVGDMRPIETMVSLPDRNAAMAVLGLAAVRRRELTMMRSRWSTAFLTALLLALPLACTPSGSSIGIWDFRIVERNLRLAPEGEATLTLDVVAGSGVDRSATWESANPAVASVDANGVVRGVAAGTVAIRAISRADDAFEDTVSVVVLAPPPVPAPGIELIDGEPVEVERVVTGDAVTIESEGLGLSLGGTDPNGNPLPVAPSDGVIRAPANGAIRFRASGFFPRSIVDLWLNSEPILLGSPEADEEGAIDTDLTFPPGTPEGDHTFVVEGTDSEGRNRVLSTTMNVLPAADEDEEPGAPPQPLAVTIDQIDPVHPITDGTATFTATVVAAAGADTTVTWQSSDESVASIDPQGDATLLSVGQTTIRATTSNGLSAETTLWVTPGAAARLRILIAPEGGVAGEILPIQPAVQAQDAFDNVVPGPTPIRVQLTSPGVLGGTLTITTDESGIATFADLTVGGAADTPLTLRFTSGALAVDADPITLTPATAAALRVVTQPVGAASGTPLATQPVIAAEDAFGNRASDVRSVNVTLLDPAGATLAGTTTLGTDAASQAAWSDLIVTGVTGRGYVLRFASEELSVDANPLTLTPGAPAQLLVTTAPVGGAAGGLLTTQPAVTIRDASGNVVVAPQSVTVAVIEAGAAVTGTTTVTSVGGVATFTDLSLTATPGTPVTLRFSSGPLTVDAPGVTVTAGAATELSISTVPVAGASGAPFATMPVIGARDAFGNPVPLTATVTVAVQSGPAARLAGTTTIAAAAGAATFTDLTLAGVANSQVTLRFSAPGLDDVTAIVIPSAGPIALHTSGVTALASALETSQQTTITVTLRDVHYATAPTGAATIAFLPLAHADRGSIGSVTALGGGVYQATFTAGTRPGLARIRPTVNGVPISDSVTIDVLGACDLSVPDDHATIAAAVAAAQPHDVICVAAGNHAVANVGLGKALTIRGAQAGVDARTRVDADGQPLDVAAETVIVGTGRIFDLNAAHVTIDGVTFADLRARGLDSYQNPDHFTLRNSIILSTAGSTSGGAIQFGGGTNLTADHFTFERNVTANRGGYALYFGHSVDYGTIRDNLIRGSYLAFGPFGERVGWSIAGNTMDGTIGGTPRTGYGINANLGDVIIRDNVARSMYVGLGQVSIVGGMVRGNTFDDAAFAAMQIWGGEFGSVVSRDVVIAYNDFTYDGVAAPNQAHALRLRPGASSDASTFALYFNRFTALGVAGSDVWAIRHNMEGALDATLNHWGATLTPEAARIGKLTADAGSGLGVTLPRIGTFTADPGRVGDPGFWPTNVVPANP